MHHISAVVSASIFLILSSLLATSNARALEAPVLTVVSPDGALWALPPEQPPVLLRKDIGRGAAVTDLAWNPAKAELLIVRRVTQSGDPYDTLLRLDMTTGQEEVLEEAIGPEARVSRPAWSPDGAWGIARVECCLSRELVRFNVPTLVGTPNRINTNEFLPPSDREVALAEAAYVNTAGEIVVSVSCCVGEGPTDDPAGIYAVAPTYEKYRQIISGEHGVPIGEAPDGSWLASLEPVDGKDEYRLMILPSDGDLREMPSPSKGRLADRGTVLADGTVIVASLPQDVQSLTPRMVDVWAINSASGTQRNLTERYRSGFTAFGFAPASVIQGIQPDDAESATRTMSRAQPTRIFLSREPESFTDFTAVVPVVRGPLTPAEAVRALLAGPTAQEQAEGLFTELPRMTFGESSCEADFELIIESGTATIRFCRAWASAGIGQDARGKAQLEATLRQFASIQQVTVVNRDGREVLSGR
jgi:hypothetical protein